jgi:hypothetical protein
MIALGIVMLVIAVEAIVLCSMLEKTAFGIGIAFVIVVLAIKLFASAKKM